MMVKKLSKNVAVPTRFTLHDVEDEEEWKTNLSFDYFPAGKSSFQLRDYCDNV